MSLNRRHRLSDPFCKISITRQFVYRKSGDTAGNCSTYLTHKRYNSAHINPQTFFKNIPGYKGRDALSMLLPTKMKGKLNKDWAHKLSDIHRQYDSHWKKSGKTLHQNRHKFPNEEIPARMLLNVMRTAVQKLPHLDQKTKKTIEWIMEREFVMTIQSTGKTISQTRIKIPKITSY